MFRATVLDFKRLNNSKNGSPRYEFKLSDLGYAKTESDAMWVYALTPDRFIGKEVDVEYRTTPTGRIVLENLKEVTQC
jgi:hypothetical protein